MRRAVACALLLSACALDKLELDVGERGPFYGSGPVDDPSDELYHPANLPRFDLEIPAASLEALWDDPDDYVPATLRYRGEVYPEVGVRLKGRTSFRNLDGKAAFKVKLDEYRDGQTLRGLTRLTFNNAVQDATVLGERLSYELGRAAALPTPRANNCLVYVNDEFYGVYANVEQPDKTFLARWFDDVNGNLYEGGRMDLIPGAEDWFELDTNEDADDRSDLTALIDAVHRSTPETFIAEVEPVLDLDRYLRFAAHEAVVNKFDGYSFGGNPVNNWRLYHDPATGRFTFIPSGMDATNQPLVAPQLVHDWVEPVDDLDPLAGTSRLLWLCLRGAECRARYLDWVAKLTVLMEELDLAGQAALYAEQIRNDLRADIRKPGDDVYHEEMHQVQQAFVADRPAAVRARIGR